MAVAAAATFMALQFFGVSLPFLASRRIRMAVIFIFVAFLIIAGSLGAIIKLLTDISQTLSRIEANAARKNDDSR
jgi:hypothetical protein